MTVTVSDRGLAAVVDALVGASRTDRGTAIVGGHDEDYEVSVAGGESVLVRMRGGALHVLDVGEGQPGFCAYTRVELDPAAIPSLLDGSVTPAEAADSGTMLMRSRLYGGGQFMGLLRLAQTLRTADVPRPSRATS